MGNFNYNAYSFVCDQYAFRSWFLFGEQPAYSLQDAYVAGLKPLDNYTTSVVAADPLHVGQNPWPDLSQWTVDTLTLGREFQGNDQMGYKVALCERCTAIYLAMFANCLIFSIRGVRGTLRPPRAWRYILIGMIPIGIDGFTQLLSKPPFNVFPLYESTPLMRTLTGGLFGLMSAWLVLPSFEASMYDARLEVEAKLVAWRQRQNSVHGAKRHIRH